MTNLMSSIFATFWQCKRSMNWQLKFPLAWGNPLEVQSQWIRGSHHCTNTHMFWLCRVCGWLVLMGDQIADFRTASRKFWTWCGEKKQTDLKIPGAIISFFLLSTLFLVDKEMDRTEAENWRTFTEGTKRICSCFEPSVICGVFYLTVNSSSTTQSTR